jgi:hypothetical protein
MNGLALIFLLVAFIFSFFSMALNFTAVDMNWAALMFGALAILATVKYFVSVERGTSHLSRWASRST